MGLKNNFYFFSLAATGTGISGGDRIFIELARNWSETNNVTIYTSTEGERICKTQKLSGKYLVVKKINNKYLENKFLLNYLYKIFLGIRLGLTLDIPNDKHTFIYSASEFWMDSFPAILIKLKNPKIKWIASWYQTAPSPIKGFTQVSRSNSYKMSALFYWLMQLPIKPLIKLFADKVIVNNEGERRQFLNLQKQNKVLVLIGAVRLDEINKYLKSHKNTEKLYDAVFQGRFHPQKGVVELIKIWKKVSKQNHNAKLVMIGAGPLMTEVKKEIKKLKLDNNIILKGFVFDGGEKYQIFSQSKIVVHPAYYDSGGMAAAEAMAFGLPCVGFNLPSYKSYYPKGMVKVEQGDLNKFSKEILHLLSDKKYYYKYAIDAMQLIRNRWSWRIRSKELYEAITKKIY